MYNVPKHKLFHTSAKDLDELVNPFEEDEDGEENDQPGNAPGDTEDEEQVGWIADNKSTRLHCLFQMMYYGLHNGTKKTPMHMMFGHSLYARDRSKTLMTGFNRVIVCA